MKIADEQQSNLVERQSGRIVQASIEDVPAILRLVTELACYEKLEHEAVATREDFEKNLFGPQRFAEVLLLEEAGQKVGFALYFFNFSTFLGRPGIYLEDLYIQPHCRGRGYGKRLLSYLAKTAVARGCGRLEWQVLNWNQPAIDFYLSLGSQPMSEWTQHRATGAALIQLASHAVD